MLSEQEFVINLPKFDYMSQKNTYSGSFRNFRYKLYVEKKDEIESVVVAAVYFNNCFEVEDEAGRTTKKEFEYSNDGIESASEWILQKYQETQ